MVTGSISSSNTTKENRDIFSQFKCTVSNQPRENLDNYRFVNTVPVLRYSGFTEPFY